MKFTTRYCKRFFLKWMFLFAQSCFLSSPVTNLSCVYVVPGCTLLFDQANSISSKVVWAIYVTTVDPWRFLRLTPDSAYRAQSRWLKKSTSLPTLPHRRDTGDSRRSSFAWSRTQDGPLPNLSTRDGIVSFGCSTNSLMRSNSRSQKMARKIHWFGCPVIESQRLQLCFQPKSQGDSDWLACRCFQQREASDLEPVSNWS